MIDPIFSEAWVHAPNGHTVLGRVLHPLCALDLLALESINSPFLLEGGTARLEDLLLAAWILSNPHAKDCTIGNLEPTEECLEWIAGVERSALDMEKECEAVCRYVRDFYSIPEMMRDVAKNPMTPLGCPWMLSTVVTVCRTLHIPLYDAWTMGIGQLMWYRCSIEELDSDARVIGPELRGEMKQATHAINEYKREPGESIEAFSERSGISVAEAEFLLR